MKRQSIISAVLIALGVSLVFAAPSEASRGDKLAGDPFGTLYARSDQDDARDAVRSGQFISMEQALSVVRSQFPGRLLDAGFSRSSGIYNIKMLSGGEVVLVAVDARDGRIVNVRRGGR
jgi:hypothetical protein